MAAAIRIVSPDAASEIARAIVLQGAVPDVQLLVLLPFTPLTYHVLAEAAALIRHKNVSSNVLVGSVCFTIASLFVWTYGTCGLRGLGCDCNLRTRLRAKGLVQAPQRGR